MCWHNCEVRKQDQCTYTLDSDNTATQASSWPLYCVHVCILNRWHSITVSWQQMLNQ